MARLVLHGGDCCGMRHIHEFRDEDENNNIAELKRQVAIVADNTYNLEVILSDRQTQNNPGLVDELARLGFVYTTPWTGNHGTPVHLFHRAKTRLALQDAHFFNRWCQNGGMLPNPGLGGRLPVWNEQPGQRNHAGEVNPNQLRERRYNHIIPGDVVRVRGGSRRAGRTFTVTRTGIMRNNYGYPSTRIFMNDVRENNAEFGIIPTNCVIMIRIENRPQVHDRQNNANAPDPATVYRHPALGERNEPQPNDAPQEPVDVLTEWFANLRTVGLRGPFTTREEAVAAFPRCRNFTCRSVRSDGTTHSFDRRITPND